MAKMILKSIQSNEIKGRFKNKDITREELFELVSEFTNSIKEGNTKEKGWPKQPFSIYGISKLAINIYQAILARN